LRKEIGDSAVSQKDGFTRILQFYGDDCAISSSPQADLPAGATLVSLGPLPAGYYRIDFNYGMGPVGGAPAVHYNNISLETMHHNLGRMFTLPVKGLPFYIVTHANLMANDIVSMKIVDQENAGIVHNGYICAIRVK
jgi:hypothetical protein